MDDGFAVALAAVEEEEEEEEEEDGVVRYDDDEGDTIAFLPPIAASGCGSFFSSCGFTFAVAVVVVAVAVAVGVAVINAALISADFSKVNLRELALACGVVPVLAAP